MAKKSKKKKKQAKQADQVALPHGIGARAESDGALATGGFEVPGPLPAFRVGQVLSFEMAIAGEVRGDREVEILGAGIALHTLLEAQGLVRGGGAHGGAELEPHGQGREPTRSRWAHLWEWP